MKVLLINGSPRQQGNTAIALAVVARQLEKNGIDSETVWNIVFGREAGQAALDAEGLQTMRALANNMAWLLKATGGKTAPGRGDEPWEPMHFIR